MRIFGLKRTHHGHRGIILVMHTEYDLDGAAVIQSKEGLEIAREVRLTLVKRLQNGDRGTWRGRAVGGSHEPAGQYRGEEGIARAHHCGGREAPADIQQKRMHAQRYKAPRRILTKSSILEWEGQSVTFATIGNYVALFHKYMK
jgi:hypothetical protein